MIKIKDTNRLGYYVYCYKDKTGKVIYVGKGENNRALEHPELKDATCYIVRYGLEEEQALEIESVLIDFVGIKALKNKIVGAEGHGTLYTIDEINREGALPILNTKYKLVLFNIAKLYRQGMSEEELLDKGSGWWPGKHHTRAQLADYAGVYSLGIVRGVWKIDHWVSKRAKVHPAYKYPTKIKFIGSPVNEKTSGAIIGKYLGHKPSGVVYKNIPEIDT